MRLISPPKQSLGRPQIVILNGVKNLIELDGLSILIKWILNDPILPGAGDLATDLVPRRH